MKVLVIRFSSIGDVVLTTPVLRCLSKQIKNSEIHFITKKAFEPVVINNPYVSKIHTIDKSIDEVIDQLKAEKFDIVIDLHKNIRTLLLKKKLGVKSYSFPKLNFQKWLLVNFKRNKMPDVHVVDRYFDAVKPLGVKSDLLSGDFFLSQKELRDFPLESKTYVSVAIGAQFATKILPVNKLVEIIDQLKSPVVLIGGPTDVERSNSIMELTKNKFVTNTVNKYSLSESATIVSHAKVLLTHDTGMMHIAACFGVPIVSIWGNTVPALGMYPYYPNNTGEFSIHEVPNLSCRPCSKIGYASCPKKHFSCMELQDVDAISKDVNQY